MASIATDSTQLGGADSPVQNPPVVPVDDERQSGKATCWSDAADLRAPSLVNAHQAFEWLVTLNKWPGIATSVGRFAHDIGHHGTYPSKRFFIDIID